MSADIFALLENSYYVTFFNAFPSPQLTSCDVTRSVLSAVKDHYVFFYYSLQFQIFKELLMTILIYHQFYKVCF